MFCDKTGSKMKCFITKWRKCICKNIQHNSECEMTFLDETTIKSVPVFIQSLWKLVNNPETNHLISWNKFGNGFIVHNEAGFFRDLMSPYFKHSCFRSFHRALNGYGFKKTSNTKAMSGSHIDTQIEFSHRHFQKDKPEKLKHIIRLKKCSSRIKSQEEQQGSCESAELADIVKDVDWVHNKQSKASSQVSVMKKESTTLWREFVILRQKHRKQQQIVNKVVDFLDTLVSSSPRIRAKLEVDLPHLSSKFSSIRSNV